VKDYTERILKRATEQLQKEGKTVDEAFAEIEVPVVVDKKKIKDDLKAKKSK